jgi:hypothetical protein
MQTLAAELGIDVADVGVVVGWLTADAVLDERSSWSCGAFSTQRGSNLERPPGADRNRTARSEHRLDQPGRRRP